MPGLPRWPRQLEKSAQRLGGNKKLTMFFEKKKPNSFILESQEQELKPQRLRVFLVFLRDAKTTLLQVPMINLM